VRTGRLQTTRNDAVVRYFYMPGNNYSSLGRLIKFTLLLNIMVTRVEKNFNLTVILKKKTRVLPCTDNLLLLWQLLLRDSSQHNDCTTSLKFEVSNTSRDKRFVSTSKRLYRLRSPLSLLSNRYQISCPAWGVIFFCIYYTSCCDILLIIPQ
jgi:hypothetical protein